MLASIFGNMSAKIKQAIDLLEIKNYKGAIKILTPYIAKSSGSTVDHSKVGDDDGVVVIVRLCVQ